jgi:hypothetical protein
MLISLLEGFYLKFPPLPEEIREYITKALPMLSMVLGILLVIASILDIIGTPFLSAFTSHTGLPALQLLLVLDVLGIAQGILMLSAVPRLNHRQLAGWKLIFWSQFLWVIASIISFSASLLIALVLFYFLFQIKRYYH